MQLKTILNHVERHKSFVYQEARWADAQTKTEIEIPIQPRANSRPICSGCGHTRPGYDRLGPRRFEFVPLWGIAVFFVYALRRVNCPQCGVRAERVPWADGKCQLTTSYQWFLARWARRLSWKQVADGCNYHPAWAQAELMQRTGRGFLVRVESGIRRTRPTRR